MPSETRPRETPTAPRRLQTLLFRQMYSGLVEPKSVSRMTFRILGALGRHPFVRRGVQYYVQRVQRYCHIPAFQGDVGFDVITADEDEQLTTVGERRRDEIRSLLLNGGVRWGRPVDDRPGYWAGDGRTAAMPFRQANMWLVDDSYVYGSAGIRIEHGTDARRYPVCWFRPVPGASIRIADPDLYKHEYRQDEKIVEWVLLDPDNNVEYELQWDEFGYYCRLPSTDPLDMGYGRTEIEYAVDLLAGLHYAYQYNLGQFTENRMPPGILQIPDVDETTLDEFISTLELNIGGPAGRWQAIPIIRAPVGTDRPQVQWLPIGERPSDMQWERYIVLSACLLWGLMGINPEELGFPGVDLRRQALQAEDPETRIEHGQESGFIPLMESLASFWNDEVVSKFDQGAWKFTWVNLGSEREEYATRMAQARLSAGKSCIDEERTWADRPLRRIPQDRALWYQVEGAVNKHFPHLYDDPDKQYEVCSRLYMAKGGAWSLSTQVPLAGTALQVWQMEEMQGTGEEGGGEEQEDLMAMMGGQAGGPGAGEAPGQPGEEELEPQELPPEMPPQQKGLVRRFRDGIRRVIEVTIPRA